MAESRQTAAARVFQVGPDQVTVTGEEVLLETRRPMPDWQVRELNPVPVYFEDRKYLLTERHKGTRPYAATYVLKLWPADQVTNSFRFHTYDEQTVVERDATWRGGQAAEGIRLLLLPLYPFLGLLWSGTQDQLTRFGFVPRYLTRSSIMVMGLAVIPGAFLGILLAGVVPALATMAMLFLVVAMLDALMRSHYYNRDDAWTGGFLEWLLPTVSESPARREHLGPGFWASLETFIFSTAEEAAPSPRLARPGPSLHVPAIIERELRVALRKLQPIRRRWRLATICTAGAIVLSLLAGRSAGRDLHHLLCLAGFYVVARVPQRIAGLFSSERREQTLGLLFISGMSASEVFVSKTISAAAIVFSDLLAVMPVLALPFLMGGVSFELFLATALCLPNLLLFALAVCLLGSALSGDEGTAVMLTVGLGLAFATVPPALYFAHNVFSSGTQPVRWLLLCSPAYGPWLVFKGFSAGQSVAFWRNFLITFSWSVFCLTAAAFVLVRVWRERNRRGWFRRWRERWQDSTHGTASWRRRLAAEWLEANPFAWLAARDRRPATLAWLLVGFLTLLWFAGWALWPAKWPSVANFFITATVMNLALRWMIHYTAAAGLTQPRRDGSYEWLLTTPLPTADIVRGQLDALRCHFRVPCLAVLGLEIVMMLAGLGLRQWTANSLLVYFILWAGLLSWEWNQSWNPRGAIQSMWAGLNSGQPLKAVWSVMGFNFWVWILLLFNLRQGISGLRNFPAGSLDERLWIFAGGLIFIAVVLRSRSNSRLLERRLAAEFREIESEPLPDLQDPRFQHWNVRERFPQA